MATVALNSQIETEKLGEKIGSQLEGGEIIELVGDVGAGKTIFVRGLARGSGSKDKVASPTFTVSKIYNSEKTRLIHYDFYRLNDLEIIKHELAENSQDNKVVIVLEWANRVQDAIDQEHIVINFVHGKDNLRLLNFDIPTKYNYIKLQ